MNTREELVASCITMVHHLARQYASRSTAISLEDLVGEGYVGLVQAAQKYQEGRGVKFSTFAMSRIRGSMMDSLRRDLPLSRPMAGKVASFAEQQGEMYDELGREPTDEELCDRLHLPAKKLREVRRMSALRLTSLDARLDGQHAEVADESDSPEETAIRALLKKELRGHVARLMPRDREVIQRIYWQQQKHSEVARDLGISESRVSQLQTRALGRLREMMESDDELRAA